MYGKSVSNEKDMFGISLKCRNHLHALNVTRGLQTQEKKSYADTEEPEIQKEHTLVKIVCMPNLQQDIHKRGRTNESSHR